MRTAYIQSKSSKSLSQHPFGEHGVLLALPISVALWVLIVMPFM
jgi:hypothetical protein